MESNPYVIRPVPPQVGAPAGEGRDSYSWITRHSEVGQRRQVDGKRLLLICGGSIDRSPAAPQYGPNIPTSQMSAVGRAGTPRLTFCSVPLPQPVSSGGLLLAPLPCGDRVPFPSSPQAPGEPSSGCVCGPMPA